MARMKNPYGGCFRFVPFRRMAKAKKCPVDRGKLLIGLECCRNIECNACPYFANCHGICDQITQDSLAYIGFLEEQLGVTGL